jgi:LysR family transcriptional regulator, hydrogen peroxide-inducible genes activator
MVAAGAGVTLLPHLAVETESRRSRIAVRPFAAPAPARTLALVWRRRAPLGPELRQIAGVMRPPWSGGTQPPAKAPRRPARARSK